MSSICLKPAYRLLHIKVVFYLKVTCLIPCCKIKDDLKPSKTFSTKYTDILSVLVLVQNLTLYIKLISGHTKTEHDKISRKYQSDLHML